MIGLKHARSLESKGKYDQWVPNKGTTTMAHLVRSDIPFHYALADAFTICDADLGIANHGEESIEVNVVNNYSKKITSYALKRDREVSEFSPLHSSFGWYDFTITTRSDPSFERRLAGHLETGRDSMTDPAIGTALVSAP